MSTPCCGHPHGKSHTGENKKQKWSETRNAYKTVPVTRFFEHTSYRHAPPLLTFLPIRNGPPKQGEQATRPLSYDSAATHRWSGVAPHPPAAPGTPSGLAPASRRYLTAESLPSARVWRRSIQKNTKNTKNSSLGDLTQPFWSLSLIHI